jgi:paraquat-inducible protein A
MPVQRGMAYAVAALATLITAVVLPFVGFEVRGIGQAIGLADTASELVRHGAPLVGAIVFLGVVLLPAVYLVAFIVLHGRLVRQRRGRFDRTLARLIAAIDPWIMADVFVVGVLVSLTKIAGMARLDIGPAFWAYCAFVVLLLKTRLSLDGDWLWFRLAGEPKAPAGTQAGRDALPQGLTGCHACGLVNAIDDHERCYCQRCGDRLHGRHPYSIQNTLALLVLAVILYIPANALPITHTVRFGASEASTIIGGVVSFLRAGDIPIAVVIFVASVVIPLAKMLALVWLCGRAAWRFEARGLAWVRLYRVVEFIGRWSMVDVFVVAILVALIRAGSLMAISPGTAALAFAGMVIVSMMAAMTFDPRLLWRANSDAVQGQRL